MAIERTLSLIMSFPSESYPPSYRSARCSTAGFVVYQPNRPARAFTDAALYLSFIVAYLIPDRGSGPPPTVALAISRLPSSAFPIQTRSVATEP
jgi:hypothetical protein